MKRIQLRKILSDIPETTSIHGILYISKSYQKCCMGIWIFLFLTSMSISIYGCARNIEDYLKFDVRTAQQFQRISNISIPEIFFCSPNYIKRSQFGNWSIAPLFLTKMLGRDIQYQSEIFRENSKTCKSNTSSPFLDLIEIMGITEFFNNNQLTKKYFFDQIWTTYQSDVAGCWWNEKRLDPHKFFVNKLADDKMCFSFNAGKEIVQFFQSNRSVDKRKSNYIESILTTDNAASSSITFLLNVNQSEYCGTDYIKCGAGYSVYLNKQGGTLFTTLKQPINLQPGYSHNILIKPLQFEKHTENLGHCSSAYNENSIFKSSFKYAQSFCVLQELFVLVLRECRCLPGNFIDFVEILRNSVHILDVPSEYVRICNAMEKDAYLCLRNIQRKYLIQRSLTDVFPSCKQECSLADFKTQITSTLLPVRNLKNFLSQERIDWRDDKTLAKNFLLATFDLESNYVERFDEYQAITLKDLFVSMGNYIGLFLGMSFMSVFEIFVQIILRSLVFTSSKMFRTLKNILRNRLSICLEYIKKKNRTYGRRTRRRRKRPKRVVQQHQTC